MWQTKVERDGLQLTVPLISNTCLRLHVPPQNWSFSNSEKSVGSTVDHFGALWNIEKPAMFGQYWSNMDNFCAIPTPQS